MMHKRLGEILNSLGLTLICILLISRFYVSVVFCLSGFHFFPAYSTLLSPFLASYNHWKAASVTLFLLARCNFTSPAGVNRACAAVHVCSNGCLRLKLNTEIKLRNWQAIQRGLKTKHQFEVAPTFSRWGVAMFPQLIISWNLARPAGRYKNPFCACPTVSSILDIYSSPNIYFLKKYIQTFIVISFCVIYIIIRLHLKYLNKRFILFLNSI